MSQEPVKVHQDVEKAPSGYAEKVIQKTIGEIRTFLDELANGTSNYKSLHNLTEQVEHQYHGRFLIELIQNAHDALFDIEKQKANKDTPEDEGRIEVVITNEPPFGALYVANDGLPFTESNFISLSRFGQSDKDPEKHIGNKGIGFRSVLEITREPEIFSRKEKKSTSFNGFTFRFNPKIIQSFEKPIQALLNGNDNPDLDLGRPVALVDWGIGKLQAFRSRCQAMGFEGIASELRFLSPYLLPEPINDQDKSPLVQQFEEKGFATVVRLPLTTEKARDLTLKNVEELDENTVLFLNKVKSLWIETPGTNRYVTRNNRPLPKKGDAQEIDIDVIVDKTGYTNTKRYWLWEWLVGGEENPDEAEEIRKAVSDLPGKWPKVRKAEVALAVRLGESPEKGLISIFLPTEQSSGAACHLNAPFYGDIRRTKVVFDDKKFKFNKILIEKMAKRAAHIVSKHLGGKGLDEARAILDILVPISSQETNGEDWFFLIEKEFSELGLDIKEEPLLQTSDSWKSVKQASLPPRLDEPKVFTEELFYRNATFDIINEGLSSRNSQTINFFEFVNIKADPLDDWVASTIEVVAQEIAFENKVDWNDFWHDVMLLFPGKSECLKGKKVLLGTDGELHASDDSKSVFFRPRSSGDDEEVLPDRAVDENIPPELRSHIAFLNEAITVHVPRVGGGIKNHPLHGYLSSSLVQPFGVESILRNILIPATPDLPVSLDGEKDRLCRAISSWGLQLVAGLVAKDKGGKTLQYLGKLPVPCHGGWYPLDETSFGPRWYHTIGLELKSYLDVANTAETKEAAKRLLLPPDDGHWSKNISPDWGSLEKAGAFDGIRLIKIEPEDWVPSFQISRRSGVRLPENAPPGFDSETWKLFTDEVHCHLTPGYAGPFPFKVDNLYTIPGIDKFSSLNHHLHENLMQVLLRSIVKWAGNWESIWVSKIEGQSDSKSHKSPLKYWLEETPWLIDTTGKAPPEFRPRDRWFIPPAAIAGRVHQFKHLNPVPPKISMALDSDLELSEELEKLGMPRYQPESKTSSTRLLDDLAISLENPEAIANRDIFMGQVRAAWRLFEPDTEGLFPHKLIVKCGSELKTLAPSPDNPIFLPDDMSSFHHGLENHVKNILAIEPKDAKQLGMGFKKFYDLGIRFISDLKAQPIVDGEPWEETPRGDFFCEGELAWVIPVLMCCHAHAGNQAKGPHTKTFSDAMDTIRKARIFWADILEVGIWKEDRYVPVNKIDGVWLAKSSTFLATREARERLSSLGEAFSSMMNRADLEVPLKLVFSKFDGQNEPVREIIEGALKELKIGSEHLAEIEQLWLGDLGWAIRLLRPLLLALHPDADLSILTEITSEDALKQFLTGFDLSPLNQDQALSIVREANGVINFGLSLYESFGDTFQLDKWNLAMKRAGETLAKNQEADEQFQDHMDSAQVPLRSIVRKLLKDNKEIGTYTDLIEQLELLGVPDNYQNLYWDVTFQQTMVVVKPLLVSWQAPPGGIESITTAQNVDELVTKLKVLKFEPTVDPLEIFTTNRASCLKTLQTIQKTGIIWCLRKGVSFSFWDRNATDFLDFIEASLEKEGYLDICNDGKVFTISKSLPHDEEMKPFWDALDNSDNLSNFLISMDIKDEDLSSFEKKLEEIKNKAEKTKRVVSVCGKDFDNTEDNLSQLFNHIESEIHDDSLADIDLTDIAKLNEIKEKTRKKAGPSKKERRSKPKGRMSQAMKNLVGLAGEIHAYRVLRKKYGSTIVNPSSWISENSTFKFPGNSVSDDYGCDFKIKHNKKTYFIEVKASQGDEEVFELGVSEIRRAVEVANRRKEKFIIYHITDALSDSPKFRFLPNPYDKKYSKLYRIFNAGLKIQYKKI
ncbi:MAG: DUF3883 domain-containing protein [Proteobacteria bacterium]|nr:DUF3883 domain-containing protein [Pseudomonadota bacterium]